MSRTFGLSFDLERVVPCGACVCDVGYDRRAIWKSWRSPRTIWLSAAKRITRNNTASRRRFHVQIYTVHQNVRTTRARISSCQHDVSRELMFNIQVKLLNTALFEVGILGLDSSLKLIRIGRTSEDWKKTSC